MNLDTLYQDEFLVAINKPSGLLVHKSDIDKHETQNAMQILRDQLGCWVYPLHRLDKPTSGVLLFALDPDTAKHIGMQFEQHTVKKTYQAIVRGYTENSGHINHALKHTADFKHEKEKYKNKEPQSAVTDYQQLAATELQVSVDKYPTSRYSLVELYPKTGRKHQLRKHMKHINHPIIGDTTYGKNTHNNFFKNRFNSNRLLLASTAIEFIHPTNTLKTIIKAPKPEDFQRVENHLFDAN